MKTRPPSFVVFGNRLEELPESYRRYLLNAMRRDLGLGPVPLRLDFRGRSNPFDRAKDRGAAKEKFTPFRLFGSSGTTAGLIRRLRSLA